MMQNAVRQNKTIRMTTALSYDRLNRLMGINSIPAGANQLPLSFQYSYNDAIQRVRVGLHDGSYWLYEYDALGQVKSGKRYWADGTPVAGQQFEYAHDDIGNRTETKAGGDSTGGNLRTATYGANSLNQYTNRTVPGYVDVLGIGTATAAVTVNGTGAYRRGEYFHVALPVDNSSAAQYPSIVIQAVAGANSASSTGRVFLAKTPESFVHDADGNLTQDGRWAYTWDGENRLVAMEALSAVPAAAKLRVEFEYDWQGRRIGKAVKAWSGTSYTNVYVLKFLYDGWNLLAELDANRAVVRSYLWGTDMSGSFQGAGGVGGLLAVNVATNGVHFPAYDGNGNIAGLVSSASGAISARYEYGPFGESLRVTGPMGKVNPFRYSTKYTDDETDLVYYGYRYYQPSTGRWLSRDPLGEEGGINLYAFCGNDPMNKCDPLGLQMTMGVRNINIPGGIPTSPSIFDHVNPSWGFRPQDGELNQTKWFEQHYPGWVAAMKRRINDRIGRAMEAACHDGLQPGHIPTADISTEINPTMSGDPPRFPFRFFSVNPRTAKAGHNEEDYGDRPQSARWADQVLGRFVFEVNPAQVTWTRKEGIACYTWNVSLTVTDGMGLNDPEDQLREKMGEGLSASVFTGRREVRARWLLTESGCCSCSDSQ